MTKGKSSKSLATVTVEATSSRMEATATVTGIDPEDKVIVFNIRHAGAGVQFIETEPDENGSATVTFVPSSPGTYEIVVTSPLHTDEFSDLVEFEVQT